MKKLIITEEEKNQILSLHGSNLILEQANQKVSQIQTYLKTKGYDLGVTGPNKDGVDGLWGKKTRDAVKQEFNIDIDENGEVVSDTVASPETDTVASPEVDTVTSPEVDGTTTTTTTLAPNETTVTQETPEISTDIKSAFEIKRDFIQGKIDNAKLQRQYTKMNNTFNRLSSKMDQKTKDQYLASMEELKKQMG
jgi:hypothetical protein